MKKVLSIFISFMLVFSLVPATMASESLSDDIVILYTNDVHTYIDGNLSYDVIAAIKDKLEKEYKYVFLADAGDHIQGTAYGSMDKGKSIIELMNATGYDVATLGNHEFDYGMEGCLKTIELAKFPYLSANFYHEENGVRKDNVLDSYKIFTCGDEKLAFVGITTPETFTKSTPAYFQNENGDFIYGISGGNDGALLQKDVQKAIDEAKKQGATKVIGLGHLGVDPSSKPWTSEETIGAICGMDAFIDGHSHTVVEGKFVKDKDEHDVLLTQTGEYFNRIGMMVIDSETDNITTDFIECEEILAPDGKTITGYALKSDLYTGKEVVSSGKVKEIKDNWISQIDEKLGEKIGSTELVLDNYDAQGNRLVRSEETNSGDFAADALYYLFDNMDIDVDVAIMNGGGIRNFAITGDISYKICKDMHTFGNVACLQTISGQQLLDALEWASRYVGVGENGSFLHVSGITYKVDTSIDSGVKADDMDVWISGPEKYRVHSVMVFNKESGDYEPLDLNAHYNLAGYNYTLRDLGGGFAMFDGAVNVLDYVMEDYMVLANYVKGFENGDVKATNSPLKAKYPGFILDYATISGSGRITTGENTEEDITKWQNPFKDVLSEGSDAVRFVHENGFMAGISENEFGYSDFTTRAMIVTVLYRLEGEPATDKSIPFADVDMGAYYANAVSWAKQNGIVYGVTDTEFAPDRSVIRQDFATILHRYAMFKGYDVTVGGNTDILPYDDVNQISGYAAEGVKYVTENKILDSYILAVFSPKALVRRGDLAQALYRFANILYKSNAVNK